MTNTSPRYVVGISAFHHDSAACILRGSELLGAVEEERFTRRKHQGGVPMHSFRWCLDVAGISVDDISAVAVGIDPEALAERRAAFALTPTTSISQISEETLRSVLGVEAPIHFVPHHEAHAASSYHYSGYDDAAVLVADGVGDWPCTTLWHGRGDRLELLESWDFPNSLGLFYAAITSWLGFRVNNDEYKVMGLAAHGNASLTYELGTMLRPHDSLSYELDLDYFDFVTGPTMYGPRMTDLIGPARHSDEPLTSHHRNVAASAQQLLEERLIALATDAYVRTSSSRLCIAGGVGLNAVANSRVVNETPFDDVFFQPAAGDSGTALGAASAVMVELGGPRPTAMTDARLGPRYTTEAAVSTAATAEVTSETLDDQDLVTAVADLIAAGGIVGWFRGPMEFGPRALGARCLLADPRTVATRDRINMFIKERERWRPLAPIVSRDRAHEYFDTDRTLNFMIETAPVVPGAALAAVTHIDGSARPQKIDPAAMATLALLLEAVDERLGVPALVSTSFNHASEPIVMTPQDAMLSATRLGLDALVIENCLITDLELSAYRRVAVWQSRDQPADVGLNLYPL